MAVAATLPHALAPARNRQRLIESLSGSAFAFPAFLLLVLTNLVPLVVLLYLSFTDFELGALDSHFLGLDNFRKALAAFQQTNNLAPSGKLDADTWNALLSENTDPPLTS